MSFSLSSTTNSLEEAYFEPDLSWLGGDVHVTELGNSLDAIAKLNEPPLEHDCEFDRWTYEYEHYQEHELAHAPQQEYDLSGHYQSLTNQSCAAAPAVSSTEVEPAWSGDNHKLSSDTYAHAGWNKEQWKYNTTRYSASPLSKSLAGEVTRTKRPRAPAAPPPPPPPPQPSTDTIHSTGNQFKYVAYGQNRDLVLSREPSVFGEPILTFQEPGFTGDPSYHPDPMEDVDAEGEYQHAYVFGYHQYNGDMLIQGSQLLHDDPVDRQFEHPEHPAMEPSRSSQGSTLEPWIGAERSRSSSLNPSSASQSVNCPACNRKFTGDYRKRNLHRHMFSEHNEAGQPVYSCEVENCGRTFKRSDAVAVHQRKAHPYLQLSPFQPRRRKVID